MEVPASMQFLAAIRKSSTIWGISSSLSLLGAENSSTVPSLRTVGVIFLSVQGIGEDNDMDNNTIGRCPPYMPDLAEENTTLLMHCIHNRPPSFHLLLCPYTRCVWIPLSSLRDPGGFSDQKAAICGPLRVVQLNMFLRKIIVAPRSGQRRMDNP
ncbi:Os02g0559925, partial [Oryza sativa Japonica Group]